MTVSKQTKEIQHGDKGFPASRDSEASRFLTAREK